MFLFEVHLLNRVKPRDLCFLNPQRDLQHTLQDHRCGATALCGVLVFCPAFTRMHYTYPPKDGQAKLTCATGNIPGMVSLPANSRTNPAAHGRELNSQPVDYMSDALTITPQSHL